jgi:hypothetical protein
MPSIAKYKSVNIPELFRPIIQQVENNLIADLAVFNISKIKYLYGTWNYCTNEIATLARNPQQANSMFPLIALITDYTQVFENAVQFETELKFVICNLAQVNTRNEERYSINFEKILYPIYDEFLAVCEDSNIFLGYANRGIAHSKDEKPFQGIDTELGTNALQMHEVFDGILITNFKIKLQKNKIC